MTRRVDGNVTLVADSAHLVRPVKIRWDKFLLGSHGIVTSAGGSWYVHMYYQSRCSVRKRREASLEQRSQTLIHMVDAIVRGTNLI